MRLLAVLLFLLIAAPLAHAEAGLHPASLSAQDKADIERIQKYLNNMHNMSADFMQIDDQGGIMHGTIKLQRPGKMRVDYTDPGNHDFIIADGSMVHIWNQDLNSQTNVSEDGSLANFILRDPIHLSGDVTITHFQRFPAKLEVTLVQTDDPASGSLTLIFEDNPLLLRQWRVVDAQGRTTGVNLNNEQTDVEYPGSTFVFTPPNFGKSTKAPEAATRTLQRAYP